MTAREVYEGILIELNKHGFPSLLLDEFNYYINKGMYQWVNRRYSVYDMNQQTSDDLQVLKAFSVLQGQNIRHVGSSQPARSGGQITEAKYAVTLPEDYFHLLNCVLTYTLQKDYKCYDAGYKIRMAARRITQDGYAAVLNDAFLKPQYKNPYYLINSNPLTVQGDWATSNSYNNDTIKDKIRQKAGKTNAHNSWEDVNANTVIDAGDRPKGPEILIDYGKDNSVFALTQVEVNYLKVPGMVRITPEQIDRTEDLSQVMEFPDYVCREIIKETVPLIMLRNGDPSLQSHVVLNESIPRHPGATNQQAQ